VNECLVNNGGCHKARNCYNTPGSVECSECGSGWTNDGDMLCQDIDECADSDGGCDGLRKCKNTPGSMFCTDCSAGYSNDGDKGCKDIDECQENNGGCHEKRECVNTVGSSECKECPAGYTTLGEKDCKETNFVLDGAAIIPDEWIHDSNKQKLGKLLFKASRDGWYAYDGFHSRCDDQGPTIVVIQHPDGYIFGGYTQQSWREVGGNYVEDFKAWLYWIKCKQGIPERKMNVRTDGNQVYAIYPNNSYGPTFGGAHDIYVENDMHNGYIGWGHTYPLPSGYDNSFLTGVGGTQMHQLAKEIEVYKVI